MWGCGRYVEISLHWLFLYRLSLTVKKILITRLHALIRKERQTAGRTNPREGEIVWLFLSISKKGREFMTTVTKNSDSKWSLINYTDVWGNPVDGWEVNDLETMYEDLYIKPTSTDQEIIHYLKTTGYLSTDNPDTVALEDYGDGMVEIVMCSDGFPLGRLQKNIM